MWPLVSHITGSNSRRTGKVSRRTATPISAGIEAQLAEMEAALSG